MKKSFQKPYLIGDNKILCVECGLEKIKSKFEFSIRLNQHSAYCKKCVELIKNEKYIFKIHGIDGRKNKPKQSKEEIDLTRRLYVINRLKSDFNFRLANNIRSRVNALLKGKNKSAATFDLLGCSVEFFKEHIKNKFKPGMSFENYGEWEIDHIKPCSKFDLMNPDEQKKCFNYTNTQPLWRYENRSKSNLYLE